MTVRAAHLVNALNRGTLNRYTKRPLQDSAIIFSTPGMGVSAFYCANHRVFCKYQQPPGWKTHRLFRWKMPFEVFRSGSGVSDLRRQIPLHHWQRNRFQNAIRLLCQESTRQTKPKKGQFMNFSQKALWNQSSMWIAFVFPRKNTRIHKNRRNSWTFRFGPFFGLVCRGRRLIVDYVINSPRFFWWDHFKMFTPNNSLTIIWCNYCEVNSVV